jgi:hypothetical protein
MSGPRILHVGEEPPPLDTPPRPARNGSAAGGPKGSAADGRGRGEGRFRTLNTFVDVAMARLTRAEVGVWLVLYRDCRDGTARTGQADIARRAGLNVRNVRRALGRLQALGLVEVVHRGGYRRSASRYKVHAEPRTG